MDIGTDQLMSLAFMVLLGILLILTRRFWADLGARSIMRVNSKAVERACLIGGILFISVGLFAFAMSVFFPAEPAPEAAQAEEPSCLEQLFGAILGLGSGLYAAINHRRIAERSSEYYGNTDLLAKAYLIAGIVFILFGMIFATGAYEFCLGR